MTLIDELKEDLEEAVRERDEDLRDAIRLILNQLQLAEKELQRPLTTDEELQVLQRERKRRVEAAEAFRAAGREEQAEDEEYELEVLEDYMPDPLSDDELEDIVDDVIAEVGATSMRRLRSGDGGRDATGVRPRGRLGREPDRPREARLACSTRPVPRRLAGNACERRECRAAPHLGARDSLPESSHAPRARVRAGSVPSASRRGST